MLTQLQPTNRNGPLIMEAAGLAGAGKTTLLRALAKHDNRIRVVSDLEIRNTRHLPIFVTHARFLLSLFRYRHRNVREQFTWDEMKAMVYLQTWPQRLEAEAGDGIAILLNHGPIFKLATLHAFGPEALRGQSFEPWWHTVFAQWAKALELIIWLDAPQEILIERINARSQRHAVKGRSEAEAADFLARYQRSYAYILKQLATYGAPTPMTFDSSEAPVEGIVQAVLHHIYTRLGVGEGLNVR